MSQNANLSQAEHEIVTTLINTKAVDFEALGKVLAKFGPTAATTLSGEDFFCGTMRNFIRAYRLPGPIGGPVQDLGVLRQVAGELKG